MAERKLTHSVTFDASGSFGFAQDDRVSVTSLSKAFLVFWARAVNRRSLRCAKRWNCLASVEMTKSCADGERLRVARHGIVEWQGGDLVRGENAFEVCWDIAGFRRWVDRVVGWRCGGADFGASQ